MTERVQFNTPVGRFVSGSLTEMRDKDINGRPIEPDKQRREFGLAIAKTDAGLPDLFGKLSAAAKSGYANRPDIQQRVDAWFQTMSGFSMKISDGDKPNTRGQINENTKGHYVLWFSTSLGIQCCNAQNVQIDPASIKRGWFVDVAGTAAPNGLLDHNAGIYLNPGWVRLIAEGDEIVGGMSAEDAFGNAPAAPAALPPGARAVGSAPAAPAGSGAPGGGMPGAPVGNPAPDPAPTGPAAMPGQAGMPGAAPQPTASPGNTGYPQHHDVLQPGQPPAGAPGLPGLPGQ